MTLETAPDAASGKTERLAIRVSDSGSGMSQATVDKLFTPYFTTKASGTGLGLTITRQIIEQHDGEIIVQSRQGKGSTFTILLPRSAEVGV